jgi:hypothetical protein
MKLRTEDHLTNTEIAIRDAYGLMSSIVAIHRRNFELPFPRGTARSLQISSPRATTPTQWVRSMRIVDIGHNRQPAKTENKAVEYRALHFGGLSAGLWVGIGRSSGSSKLRSTSNAACIQVFAISNNIWRCLSDLVSAAQRKQSCANSRYSLGDAAMARAFAEFGSA